LSTADGALSSVLERVNIVFYKTYVCAVKMFFPCTSN